MVIGQPEPRECDILTELALRSKAVWGYDAAFIEACRDELTITPFRLSTEIVRVARDPEIVGFFSVAVNETDADLMDLFVDPDLIGRGIGTRLFNEAVGAAREAGATRLTIEADPHAEDWYAGLGATRIGEAPSGSIPGRMLPLLALSLT